MIDGLSKPSSAWHQEADCPAGEWRLAAIGGFEPLKEAHLRFGFSRILFDEKGQPKASLLRILALAGMELSAGASIEQINAWVQKNLLRQGERWEEQTGRFEPLRPLIFPLLKELGFVDARLPQFAAYQGAIVHGALLSRVRLRLQELVLQWERGVRFSRLYFLSGERPLEPQHESSGWCAPEPFPKNECEMIQWVWDQSEILEAMRRDVEVYFINVPMKKAPGSEKLLRPTTDDTVEAWLATSPLPGRYLVVSNAPYINRQDAVMRMMAPKEYGFDTIGPAANPEEKIVIFLDELARLIFQTKTLSNENLPYNQTSCPMCRCRLYCLGECDV